MCARYRRLYVPAISDVLDACGNWEHTMDIGIRPLLMKHKVAGPAFTMLGVASREMDKTKRLAVRALDELYPDCVPVLSASGDEKTGHFGELMTNVCLYHGCTGAVVDGGLRDTGAILKLDFPIFHRFHCPNDALGRYNVVEYECPLVAGGVKVNPGDFIVGDCDGVVVVPRELAEEVLLKAESVVDVETEIRGRLLKGEKMAELYQQYDQF